MANQDKRQDEIEVHTDTLDISGDDFNVDRMVEEFRSVKEGDEQKIIEPIASGTADALTAVPKVKPAVTEIPAAAPADEQPQKPVGKKRKRNPFMRFFGAIVPRIGDGTFDVIRKVIMLVGILVFVGAATYLVDDLVLIPIQNTVLADSLYAMYTPGVEPPLSAEEQSFNYPEGMDPSFKKLYYKNSDVRGWLSYQSTDSATINVEYPVLQSVDNDYYLFHDYNHSYNKNGSLFFDYRNKLDTATSKNYNTIIYGHNMASGQMLAGLNKLIRGVNYARVAPTFSLSTLYTQSDYKVFAVMVLNNDPNDGEPFNYLRTEFTDSVDYANFLAGVMARSLYVYGDVDVRPDDEIVMLSTCTQTSDVHFNDGRTVVVARKVREGEDPNTNVNTITNNSDVIMPYAWYVNQNYEPHPYYVDAAYGIPQLDTLDEYLATATNPSNGATSTTTPNLTLPGGIETLPPGSTTMTLPTMPTGPVTTQAYMKSIYVDYTPKLYEVGAEFDHANTRIYGVYSDGTRALLNSKHCGIERFDTSMPGKRFITVHYGELSTQFTITVYAPSATTGTTATTTTTVAPDDTTTTLPPDVTAPTAAPDPVIAQDPATADESAA